MCTEFLTEDSNGRDYLGELNAFAWIIFKVNMVEWCRLDPSGLALGLLVGCYEHSFIKCKRSLE